MTTTNKQFAVGDCYAGRDGQKFVCRARWDVRRKARTVQMVKFNREDDGIETGEEFVNEVQVNHNGDEFAAGLFTAADGIQYSIIISAARKTQKAQRGML